MCAVEVAIPPVKVGLDRVWVTTLLRTGAIHDALFTYVKLLLVLIRCMFRLPVVTLSIVVVERELETIMLLQLMSLCSALLTTPSENVVGVDELTCRQAVSDTTITVGPVRPTAAPNVFTRLLLSAAAALRTFLAAKLAPLAIVFKLGQRPMAVLMFVLCTFLMNVTLRRVPLPELKLKLWPSVLTGVPEECPIRIAFNIGVRLMPTLVRPSRLF